ncbi:MAG: cupin [Alphaproteobacteria bacterium]|nr:cupin [Alphaproteobacteria bacterium]
MTKTFARVVRAGAAAAAFSLFAVAQASAGECPAGSVGVDVTAPGPMTPSGVTDTVIASIDLGEGYNIPGRQFRMRRLVVEPGGVVPWHAHNERPANIYIISGQITEYRSTCAVPILHRQGEVVPESGATAHWWRNNSRHRAVLISADILPPQAAPEETM